MNRPGTDFARVLAAETVSNFGSMLSRLVIPWWAALALQATPAQMAVLLLADVAAAALGSLLLGPWVDRHGKRAAMVMADGLRAALLAVLALAAWQGALGYAALVAASAASGVLTVSFEMARSAWTAQRVQVDDLPRRNAQLSMAGSLSETAAFAIGGWLYQGLGAALALAIDAVSYAASALCLRGVNEAPHAGRGPKSASRWRALLDDATAGLRLVQGQPVLHALATAHALVAVAMALFGTAYMIHVSRDLALPTGPLGMVFAVGALGALAGAVLAPVLGRRIGTGRALACGLLVFAIGLACAPLAGLAGQATWVAIAWLVAQQIVGDAGHALQDVHDRTLRQTSVGPEALARADAGIRSAGHFATLAGAVAGGAVGTFAGARSVLWVAVAAAVAAAVWAWMRLPARSG